MGCGCKGACVSLGCGVASGSCVARYSTLPRISGLGTAGLASKRKELRPYLSPSVSLCGYCAWVKLVLLRWHVQTHVCFYMRTLGAGVRRTAYALHARGLRLCRLLLGYASVLMSCIGILYYKCILYSVVFMMRRGARARARARVRVYAHVLYWYLVLQMYSVFCVRA